MAPSKTITYISDYLWNFPYYIFLSFFQSTTFHVVYKNIPAALTLHWTDGFLLKPFASPTFAFTYSFSQLKGSSDDGNATLTLLFQEPDARDQDLVEQVRKIIGTLIVLLL